MKWPGEVAAEQEHHPVFRSLEPAPAGKARPELGLEEIGQQRAGQQDREEVDQPDEKLLRFEIHGAAEQAVLPA